MKQSLLVSIFTLILMACGFSLAQADGINMAASSPYADEGDIQDNILNECTTLGNKLASFTQSYSDKQGIKINLVDSIDTSGSGKTLKLEISDAVSGGNAFLGHRKFVKVKGSLWENGKQIGSFRGQRHSGGGAFGGYKGSCSVLGRCVKTLGKDIAGWLTNPTDGAKIGE